MNQTVAKLAVDSLIENGVRNLYCVPSVQNDPFFDKVFDRTDVLRPIHARHEQGAVYMAFGGGFSDRKTTCLSQCQITDLRMNNRTKNSKWPF